MCAQAWAFSPAFDRVPIYKVKLNATSENNKEPLEFSFLGFEEGDLSIPQFHAFLLKFNTLARKNDGKIIASIENVQVIYPTLGLRGPPNAVPTENFSEFYCLFFNDTPDSAMKQGLLLALHQTKGAVIIGSWPADSHIIRHKSADQIQEFLQKILSDDSRIDNLLLVLSTFSATPPAGS